MVTVRLMVIVLGRFMSKKNMTRTKFEVDTPLKVVLTEVKKDPSFKDYPKRMVYPIKVNSTHVTLRVDPT